MYTRMAPYATGMMAGYIHLTDDHHDGKRENNHRTIAFIFEWLTLFTIAAIIFISITNPDGQIPLWEPIGAGTYSSSLLRFICFS